MSAPVSPVTTIRLSALTGRQSSSRPTRLASAAELNAGISVTEAKLREHAEATIVERPAWPKSIYFVDAIPLTTVGKIHKPQLRCEAAERLVKEVVWWQLAMEDPRIEVREGGKRRMTASTRREDLGWTGVKADRGAPENQRRLP